MDRTLFRLQRFVLVGILMALMAAPAAIHAQETLPQRIESDEAVVQRGGSWTPQSSPQASGGGYLYSSGGVDDYLTLEFSGTEIEILYIAGPALGTLKLTIDDVITRNLITTAASTAYGQSETFANLADGGHTLTVSTEDGQIVAVDAFIIQPNTLRQTANGEEGGIHASTCAPINTIHMVMRTSTGAIGLGSSYVPSISADGRYVTFSTTAELVPGDGDFLNDLYVYDRQTCTVELISVSTGGEKANDVAGTPSISDNGRYVAFASYATNLVPNDTNVASDVFVRDRQTATTIRVSVSGGGAQGNDDSFIPKISGDGRLIAFQSEASNLIATDTNAFPDIFVHNLTTSNTFRVSIATGGTQATGISSSPAISSTGRYVAFSSAATNLVAGDTNGQFDIFLRDRQLNTTTRISVATGGIEAIGGMSYQPAITTDGRYITYESSATNLVTGDTNAEMDAFLYDTTTGTTTRVSVATGGTQGDDGSGGVSISGDGRYIAFVSSATNLVTGDTNADLDVFLFDTTTGTTTRVSVSMDGEQGNRESGYPALSRDGRFIVFTSESDNLITESTGISAKPFVVPTVQPADDTLALFNPLVNQVNLIDTLADTPPHSAYTLFSTYAPVSGGTWVMGDWNGDGLDTPGVYANFVFYFTNVMGESQPSDWGGFWIGLNAPVVAGRFSSATLNDCIGVVDSALSGGVTIFALYYTCAMSGTNPAPPLSFQWLSSPLPDPVFTGTFQFSAGDFDGDGLDSIAVRRNEYIAFGNMNPAAGNAIYDLAQYIGVPGTGDNGTLVIGDWDANGTDSFGLFYQNGELFYRNDLDFNSGVFFNQTIGTPFGNTGVQVATWR